ncbi:hypothetical protein [Yoonia sp. BS5-3]|uniref:General secretion pathway protein GspC n=1 Tax=Yoonia phaeophyticola TaxID=3137369 RepID=A0ABZ3IE11_9RHOB
MEKVQSFAPLVATALCIALAGVIWLPLNSETRAETGSVQQSDAASTEDPSLGVLQNGAQSLVERPLFHVTRRPPVVAETVQSAPEQVSLVLTGVLKNDDVYIALLSLSNSNEVLRQRVGDRFSGWEIVDITPTTVTVINPDGEQQLIGLSSSN